VHCPGCGADGPVPDDAAVQVCFTCRMEWLRCDLSGDLAADAIAVAGRAEAHLDARNGAGEPSGASEPPSWAATWHPLLVDVPAVGGGKRTVTLPCAFVYFPSSKP